MRQAELEPRLVPIGIVRGPAMSDSLRSFACGMIQRLAQVGADVAD
jgi:hypothetical protein